MKLNSIHVAQFGIDIQLKNTYVPNTKQKELGTTNDNGWGIAFDIYDDTGDAYIAFLRSQALVYGFDTKDGLHYVYVRTDV